MITQDDIIYFVITDRFYNGDQTNDHNINPSKPEAFHGGDFSGLKKKIKYFQTLGITAVWLTPVYLNIHDFYDSAGYHGYWAMDFERIDPHLYSINPGIAEGSKLYLKNLVDDFHNAGLKVILDMVVNHTGYHTPAYQAYPHKKFEDRHFNVRQNNDPIKQWLSGLPDLNHDLPEVADYFIQNIIEWIEETDIDGIRMDTVKHVEPTFWYFFKSYIKTSNPEITLIGEVLDYDPSYVGSYQKDHDFDTLFDFPLCDTIKGTIIWDQPMTKLARPRLHPDEPKGILDIERPYSNANRLVTLLDNHDLERRITTEILDRVGHWDRDLARKILKLCFSLLFTTRGIPQVYYGTEIGMEGGRDPDNRRDMPWSIFGQNNKPTQNNLFERDIFDHISKMIKIRNTNPAIRYGYLFTLYVDQFLYSYLREFRGNVVLVFVNNGYDPMPFPITIEIDANSNIPVRIKQLLANGKQLISQFDSLSDITVQSGQIKVQLPGKMSGIYILE